MSKPVVLITGASGLLGQALSARLAPAFTLVGLDVVEPDDHTDLDALHHMDVSSDLSVRDAMRTVRAEYGDRLAAVVHLAAFYDFTGEPSPLYDRVTVQGTERLLRGLSDFSVDRFVFSSTTLVHAPVQPGERITEESPIDAGWPYPESKIRTERLIERHRPELPYTLLRIAGVYTDIGTQPMLVHQLKRIYERELKSFFFPGDSEAGQSVVHVEDTADAIGRTVERRKEIDDGPILIGEPDPVGYADLQNRIGELIWKEEWDAIRVPETMAKAAAWIEDKLSEGTFIEPFMIELAQDHYALDIGRARRMLGWRPWHELSAELPGIVERLLENPDTWYEANGLEAPEGVPADTGG